LLYEFTAGRLPFSADDPIALIAQHLHAPVVPPSTHNPAIPAALDALIVQLMSKQPEDRPASAAAVRQILESWQQPSTTTPTHYPTTELFAEGPRRNLPRSEPFIGRERKEIDRLWVACC
jgi:serine/threonine protein kinase